MSHARGYVTGLLAALTVSACAWWMAGRPASRPSDTIIMSHALHEQSGVACSDCHAGVEAAADLSQRHLPSEEACLTCHARSTCTLCHTKVELRTPRPPPEATLGFSHAAHLLRTGDAGCMRCHSDAESSESARLRAVPMSTCLGCHEHQAEYDDARCQHCHPSLRIFPIAAVAEFSHGYDFGLRHGVLARSQGETCQQCHTQATCADCHARRAVMTPARLFPEAVGRDLIHRGDFAATHGIDARWEGDTCLRCHATSTCVDCHGAAGLAADGRSTHTPHPAGYAVRGGVAFHGDEARLRPDSCAACHDRGAASSCVDCHRVGGVGGNPHPPGWSRGRPPAAKMCRVCH